MLTAENKYQAYTQIQTDRRQTDTETDRQTVCT